MKIKTWFYRKAGLITSVEKLKMRNEGREKDQKSL